MINLKRRTDRRERMLKTLYVQEIDCKIVEAVDGKWVSSDEALLENTKLGGFVPRIE